MSSDLITKEDVKTKYGDLIIIYENGDSVKYFTLEKGKVFQNRFGSFKHDDMVNKYFGSKIYNNKKEKYITILSFVPNIWERCINKMTQILYNPDISLIMMLLNINQNSIIYESGTGSGCLSTNMSSVLSDKGHLYTFEFNKERVDKLKDLFKLLKLDNKITVTHKDVIEYEENCIDGSMRAADRCRGTCTTGRLRRPRRWYAPDGRRNAPDGRIHADGPAGRNECRPRG